MLGVCGSVGNLPERVPNREKNNKCSKRKRATGDEKDSLDEVSEFLDIAEH